MNFVKFKGGYTNYGQTIGILMLDTIFPRLPGDIGNAETFDFPVKYKIVKGAQPNKIMGIGVGWSSYDIPVIIKGMKEDAIFPSVFIGNKPDLDLEILNYEIKEMTEEFITENPDAGAIVLECTNMCPFTRMIHDISGLPVFDINNLVNFIHYSVKPRKYII